ncbi:putative protease sohB [Thioalkalivibrio nitratireducens DSM 14787]|uniref:Protease sohB n=1 Tax=Thioalkalivibrio nitratireducens (strain DSM 14787 / UNIQEM 213 / ALEN2) TaxID=1255043 RepID=L0E340_THIND|nr:protease SohB [Thioalkalivibrio nitratireducens]AGA35051.1 putative protease sohB [Thioalkalivibrio nitratireducens DSM 14787]
MEFLQEYGLFLLKGLTILALTLGLFGAVIAGTTRGRLRDEEQLTVRHLNQRYREMERILQRKVLGRRALREHLRQYRRDRKQAARSGAQKQTRVYVLRFQGDLRATRTDNLREEVSAVLTLARPGTDRAVLCLESAGGLVPSYGLAAAQLARLREAGLELTVAVDRVAASGGYLMAAVAHRIVAAPFAVVGSIGVVAQIPNIHRLLKRHDVDIELLTAGQYKRTLTVLGKNTPEGRAKFQQELEETHGLFKAYLQRYRPQLELETLATGEHWYGEQALERGLVDELRTSDDLLLALAREHELYEVRFSRRQSLGRRIGLAVEQGLERLLRG